MSKQSKRTLDKSDTARTVVCNFCGQEHRRRSKELAECRQRHRKGLGPKPAVISTQGSPRHGDETTRYRSDALGGDKRAHAIRRLHKTGYPARKIAKELDLNLHVVEEVLRRARA